LSRWATGTDEREIEMDLMTPEQAKLLRRLAEECGEPGAYKDHLSEMQALERISILCGRLKTHNQIAAFTGRFSTARGANRAKNPDQAV